MKKIIITLFAAIVCVLSMSVCVSADEWVKTDNGYKYEYTDGSYAAKGWLKVDGNTYYIKKDGTRQTGWLKTTSSKYYFGKDGKMYKSRWLTFNDGTKYYLDEKGNAVTGFKTISGEKYYFSKDGNMKSSGWVKSSNGNKYYFKKDGTIAKNCILLIGDEIYEFNDKGNSKIIDQQISLSAYEFETYMNDLFKQEDMKKLFGNVEISCSGRLGNFFPYDIWVKVNISGMWSDCYDYTYSDKYTKSEIKEFIDKNIQLQCLIFAYAKKLLPGTKIQCGYYDSYYKYPYSKVGLVSNRAFTWVNYSKADAYYSDSKYTGKMQWFTKYDDYDFNVTNNMIKEIKIPEIELVYA